MRPATLTTTIAALEAEWDDRLREQREDLVVARGRVRLLEGEIARLKAERR